MILRRPSADVRAPAFKLRENQYVLLARIVFHLVLILFFGCFFRRGRMRRTYALCLVWFGSIPFDLFDLVLSYLIVLVWLGSLWRLGSVRFGSVRFSWVEFG